MPKTTLEALDELLRGAERDVGDPNTIYKLRSARQLVEVLKQRQGDREDAIEDAIEDEEILDDLRDLGYVQ
ncbi:hypothetical protein I7X12_09620 [Halosimplex litoreum]|uniref:Uncharacterized protein n=1 Tax=Halosimplex litoreum TaxID=1198301 RepID=A0A7U3WB40_9EURY|nr:hypothetical protein [Halosimplex litoreum]QPV64835.1 hypothetical protein I7X12_09620 [Halosimplex litoreum]